jgi:hypothetical protein
MQKCLFLSSRTYASQCAPLPGPLGEDKPSFLNRQSVLFYLFMISVRMLSISAYIVLHWITGGDWSVEKDLRVFMI